MRQVGTVAAVMSHWHECTACGCTRPDAELRRLRLVDPALGIEDDVYRCIDVALCAKLHVGRLEQAIEDGPKKGPGMALAGHQTHAGAKVPP